MPVYNVATVDALSYDARKAAAKSITDLHCGLTGAPSEFVNVLFMHGHKLKNGNALNVVCNVRSGGNRNAELTENLRTQIREGVAEATGIPVNKVDAVLLGFPASWAMEGGEILPEPGEESEWLERTHAQTPA